MTPERITPSKFAIGALKKLTSIEIAKSVYKDHKEDLPPRDFVDKLFLNILPNSAFQILTPLSTDIGLRFHENRRTTILGNSRAGIVLATVMDYGLSIPTMVLASQGNYYALAGKLAYNVGAAIFSEATDALKKDKEIPAQTSE